MQGSQLAGTLLEQRVNPLLPYSLLCQCPCVLFLNLLSPINMFDFGDELPVESYRIPWLIWIQLIVLFLLLLILFCFTLYHLDPADDDAAAATAAPASASTSANGFIFHDIQQIENDKQLAKHDSTATVVATRRRHTQGGENLSIKGEIAAGASLRREEITEGEASSLFFHPCHYFQLARVAFLKCLGLDSASDSPSTRRHRKNKES